MMILQQSKRYMGTEKFTKVLSRIMLLAIIMFFSYTLINKIINIEAFTLNIAKTGIFSVYLVDLIAYFVLFIELSCIVLLIFKEERGLQLSLLMMVIFTLYIIFLFLQDRYEVCGCGGILNGLPFLPHFFINSFIIVVLIILLKK